jgi:predicted DNA-binding transcriptional regulator YafY
MEGVFVKNQLKKYIGQVVTVIYSDQKKGYTKRRVKLLSVDGDRVRAFCLDRQAPRTFLADSVLAVEPVRLAAS